MPSTDSAVKWIIWKPIGNHLTAVLKIQPFSKLCNRLHRFRIPFFNKKNRNHLCVSGRPFSIKAFPLNSEQWVWCFLSILSRSRAILHLTSLSYLCAWKRKWNNIMWHYLLKVVSNNTMQSIPVNLCKIKSNNRSISSSTLLMAP